MALSFAATTADMLVDNKLALADLAAWLPFLNKFATFGVVALIAVTFAQIAYYFKPEDASINKQARLMARLSLGAALGYALFIPLFVISSIVASHGSVSAASILIGCIRFLAMAIGFAGVSRTKIDKEYPYSKDSIQSPLDIWLKSGSHRHK
jgi:hypothetical protein